MIVSVRSKHRLWQGLTDFIESNYRIKRDCAFYGKNYGWALRFRRGGRSFAALYPGTDAFTVQIILNPVQIDEALGLNLNAEVRTILKNARTFSEGRWLFIPVESEQDCRDVIRLLRIRAASSKKTSG